MCHGHHQFDMSGAFAAHLLLSDLDTATVAHDALVADSFVLAAAALIVACGTEDAFAEEALALGLVCTVIDGLGLGHLAVGVLKDFLGRCQSDSDLREICLDLIIFLESHIISVYVGVSRVLHLSQVHGARGAAH